MLDLRLEVRQSAAVFSNRNGSWALLKKHISGLPQYGILDGRWNFPRTAQGMSASAYSGHRGGAEECPLLGVKRTSDFQCVMSAFDPKRTSALLLFRAAL
jgi:hypothetical protein